MFGEDGAALGTQQSGVVPDRDVLLHVDELRVVSTVPPEVHERFGG